MIENIKQIFEFDWRMIFFSIILLAASSKSVIELFVWFGHGLTKFFGLETKWARKERERETLIEKHECRFADIDIALSNLEEKSDEYASKNRSQHQ